MQLTYPAKLTGDRKDGGFVVTFRDVPEAITQGDTLADALSEAEGALQAALEVRIDLLRATTGGVRRRRAQCSYSPPPARAHSARHVRSGTTSVPLLLGNFRVFDHLRPARDFGADELIELLTAGRCGWHPQFGQALLDFRAAHYRVYIGI